MVGAEPRACVSCGHALATEAVFCSACGTRQPSSCGSCGAALEDAARFCSRCGTPVDATATEAAPTGLEPVAERRWASVLFADLVGFTTLSEARDPEQVRELLSGYFDRCRVIIAGYDGVVEKFIGDAVMAVWGVPIAHEDDTERAVRAGLALAAMVTALGHDLHADLALRVGIVTGEVAATLGATSQGMVAGDPVNTAARVQTAAEPGRVYVDEATRTLTATTIDYDDTGEHTLKGKAEPMRLFAVRAVGRGQRDAEPIRTRMVGRDHELALLREIYATVVDQRRPRLIVIDGEAGVGKSRLVAEFQSWLDTLETSTRWHRGRCLSYGEGVAFRALAEAVRTRLGLVEGDPAALAVHRLEDWLTDHAATDEGLWIGPCLEVLLGLPGPATDVSRGELFAAWTRFFELVGAGQPVVLVIDDAHHADDGLLDFVEHALDSTRTPMLVVAMARPELLTRRPGWGARRATVVPLAPLDGDAMGVLVADLVDGLAPTERDALVRRSGGVPLFAIESVRSLVDHGQGELLDARVRLRPGAGALLEAADAPLTLRSLVRSRLDSLSATERRFVADASVLGLSFTLDSLAALAPDRADLDAAVAALQRREILALDEDPFSGDRGQLRFVHAVTRQVAYSTLTRRDRKVRHLAAARYVAGRQHESGELDALVAQHLLDAYQACFDDDEDRRVIADDAGRRLSSAGERALRLGAPAEGLRLLHRALELVEDPHERALVQVSAALCASVSGDPVRGAALADEALRYLEEHGTTVESGAALAAYVRSEMWAGHHERVLDAARPRLAELRSDPATRDSWIEVQENTWLAVFHLGLTEEYAAAMTELISACLESQDPRHRFRAFRYLAEDAWDSGDEDLAAHYFREAIAVAPEHGSYGVHSAYMYLAHLVSRHDLEQALSLAREGVADARRRGLTVGVHWCLETELELLFIAGRFAAMADLLDAIEESRVTSGARGHLAAMSCLWAWATEVPRPTWDMDPDAEGYGGLVSFHFAALAAALSERSTAGAARHAMTQVELQEHVEPRQSLILAAPLWSSVAIDSQDTELADRILAFVGDAELPTDALQTRAFGIFVRGRLARLAGRGDGIDHLRQALPLLDSYGSPGYAALARLDLAERLEPDDPEVTALRADAVATLERIGAHGWLPRG